MTEIGGKKTVALLVTVCLSPCVFLAHARDLFQLPLHSKTHIANHDSRILG